MKLHRLKAISNKQSALSKCLLLLIAYCLLTINTNAQPKIKGFRYEQTIKKTDVELTRYDSAGKKVYVIWRKEAVQVYPNPSTGKVWFDYYGNAVVTDITGTIVRKEFNTDRLDLTGLPPGTYLISIVTEQFTYHHLQIKL